MGGEIAVALMLDEGASLPAEWQRLQAAGVRVFSQALPPRAYLRERAHYLRWFRAYQPAVVHSHGYRADLIAGSAARALGVPRVSTVHGFTGGDWKNRLYERLQLRSFRRFARVIAVSRPIRERLLEQGLHDERIAVIPNAWSPASLPPRGPARAQLGLADADFAIGWVGRLSAEKGADVLLAALAAGAGREAVSVIVGDGRERPALERQAGELGLTAGLRWTGMVPRAASLFPAFDCYVLSSRTEGTPIALFEAMAAGVPIVATRVGGVPDVITGAEALLVPPEDPAALAQAITAVRRDPAAAATRAARAREVLALRFAPGPWLDRHLELYRAIAARRSEDLACT
jgi:glycosyltransferase involved in cell wall biosynthesis